MTLLLILTSLILISIAVWQLTKILELSKPVDYKSNEIATDKDNDIQGLNNKSLARAEYNALMHRDDRTAMQKIKEAYF